jgi:hypothetical protein
MIRLQKSKDTKMLFLIANYFFYTIVLNFHCYVHKIRVAQPVYTQYRVYLIDNLHATLYFSFLPIRFI